MRVLWAALAALVLAGCGGGDKPAARRTPAPKPTVAATATAKPTATPIPLTVADQQLCAPLYARLQRVTLALGSSSELIAQSESKDDLTRRIAKAGVDLDLVYVATRNRVVFGAEDLDALRAALDSAG